jgi:hypothetical protein
MRQGWRGLHGVYIATAHIIPALCVCAIAETEKASYITNTRQRIRQTGLTRSLRIGKVDCRNLIGFCNGYPNVMKTRSPSLLYYIVSVRRSTVLSPTIILCFFTGTYNNNNRTTSTKSMCVASFLISWWSILSSFLMAAVEYNNQTPQQRYYIIIPSSSSMRILPASQPNQPTL